MVLVDWLLWDAERELSRHVGLKKGQLSVLKSGQPPTASPLNYAVFHVHLHH